VATDSHRGASRPDVPLLSVRGLVKSFGGAPALRHVDLDFPTGEVHGLIGANGAGKSTLIKVLAGAVQPDGGTIQIDGHEVDILNGSRARALGLGFVHQELNLIPKFTIAQNLGLGQSRPARMPLLVNKRELTKSAHEAMELVGLKRDIETVTESLSVADQWLVCIGRALVHEARFIAMDEPTASLSHTEANRLFELIHSLRRQGITIAYVSHRLDEILDLCDRVTTFRDGRTVGTRPRPELSREDLVRTITNQEIPAASVGQAPALRAVASRQVVAKSVTGETPLLEINGLESGKLSAVSLAIARGEIVGLAGLVGSGRSHLLRTLFGVDRHVAGEVFLNGRRVAFKNPTEAIAAGVALIPEERRKQGLILEKSIAFNLSMASFRQASLLALLPLYSRRRANAWAKTIAGQLHIKCQSVRDPVGTLSGGNQQKVVFGRWLARRPQLLLLDEPTRGVDVGARAELHMVVRSIANDGAGVLMVSSEFQELLNCDRVLVMREGALAGQLTGESITETNMTAMCFGEAAA